MDEAAVAAGNENALAVAAERQAIPAFRQREELRSRLRFQIDERKAGVVETAAHCDEHALVGRDDHLQRHVAYMNLLAGWRDPPAAVQKIRARQHSLALPEFRGID